MSKGQVAYVVTYPTPESLTVSDALVSLAACKNIVETVNVVVPPGTKEEDLAQLHADGMLAILHEGHLDVEVMRPKTALLFVDIHPHHSFAPEDLTALLVDAQDDRKNHFALRPTLDLSTHVGFLSPAWFVWGFAMVANLFNIWLCWFQAGRQHFPFTDMCATRVKRGFPNYVRAERVKCCRWSCCTGVAWARRSSQTFVHRDASLSLFLGWILNYETSWWAWFIALGSVVPLYYFLVALPVGQHQLLGMRMSMLQGMFAVAGKGLPFHVAWLWVGSTVVNALFLYALHAFARVKWPQWGFLLYPLLFPIYLTFYPLCWMVCWAYVQYCRWHESREARQAWTGEKLRLKQNSNPKLLKEKEETVE